jgi:hypothetical protein
MATTNFTTSLKLALPTTGDLVGAWGDAINNSITTLLDTAVAGNFPKDMAALGTDWTLTSNNGATDEARYAVLIPYGNTGATRSIFAPKVSKTYIIINKTNASIIIRGGPTSPTTGVTVAAGATVIVAWNSNLATPDFVAITPASISGVVPVANGGTGTTSPSLVAGSNVTISGTWPNQTINSTGGGGGGGGTVTSVSGTGTVNGLILSGTVTTSGSLTLGGAITGFLPSSGGTLTGSLTISGSNSLKGSYGANGISTNFAAGDSALNSNTTGTNNTAVGFQSLFTNTTGTGNTSFGSNALLSSTTGAGNSAFGYQSIYLSSTGNYNSAVGYQALRANSTGYNNIAFGYQSLLVNTTGYSNSAIGANALRANTTGTFNTAIGEGALYANTTASYNSAIGFSVLVSNTTGELNSVIGSSALYNNTTGSYNSAIGYQSLYYNTTGTFNTAVGMLALTNNTTGSGNTAISPKDAAGVYLPVFDPTTQNNRFCMGSTSVTNAYIQVAWTVVSDARDKTNFAPVPHGLDFVNQLNPTSYQFKVSREDDTPTGIVRYGFKAQDILALEGDNPVIIDSEDLEKLRFNSDSLIPVLVNAIKELTTRLETLENKVN